MLLIEIFFYRNWWVYICILQHKTVDGRIRNISILLRLKVKNRPSIDNINYLICWVFYLNRNRPPDFSAAPGVVEPPDEWPEELDDSREELAEVSQDDKKQGYTNYGVYDGSYPTRSCFWRYVTISWKIENKIKGLEHRDKKAGNWTR